MIDWSECPDSGRRDTLIEALQALDGQPARIVEVGTSRNTNPASMESDGWATRVFAWYAAATSGTVATIDNRAIAVRNARQICGPWADRVVFLEGDALDLAPVVAIGSDLLYMDGPPDPAWHLSLWRAINLPIPLVLFDDVLDNSFRVKGAEVIPEMLDQGYELVFRRDRQALLAA